MSLKKQSWQQAIKHYREWNESKLVHYKSSIKKPPDEKWQEYKELYALGRLLKPEPGDWECKAKAREWEYYINSILRFEKWQRSHGTKA